MNKKKLDYLIIFIGIVLLGSGFIMLKLDNIFESVYSVSYVCIGLGCGLFGHGMGNIISKKALKNNPEVERHLEIEKNDERNLSISNKSKAKAFDVMIFVYGALMFSFAIMNVEMIVILLIVFAYLFIVGYEIYLRCKYDNEM